MLEEKRRKHTEEDYDRLYDRLIAIFIVVMTGVTVYIVWLSYMAVRLLG